MQTAPKWLVRGLAGAHRDHRHPVNMIVHLVTYLGVMATILGMIMLVSAEAAYYVTLAYVALFLYCDVATGLFWAAVFYWLYPHVTALTVLEPVTAWGVLIAGNVLVSATQIASHLVVEGAFPTIHPSEAVLFTPTLIVLWALATSTGYRAGLMKEVSQLSRPKANKTRKA